MADQPRTSMQEHHPRSRSSNVDVAAALRAQLEFELKNKKQCSYQPYQCSQLTLDGYKYCMKHILNDKNAPYKQCTYVYQSNGKRCNLPAPKYDKKDYGYCHEHALKSTLARNRQNSKYPPPHTAEVLLYSLSHYVKRPRNRVVSEESLHGVQDETEIKCTKSVDPFVDLDASAVLSERCNEILDLCSESESDVEPSTFSTVWKDYQDDSSDNESIDSDEEDPLKHANVYTAEEVTRITQEKLAKLQTLYIEQYRHLQHLLREKKRKYLHALKREKETCCNIANQVRDNPKEQRMYKKLKCYNQYHRAFGVEAVLNKRLHDLRAKLADPERNKSHGVPRCVFTEGGVKCGERALPCAKHCRKHILEDPHQVLFKVCGKVNADIECNTPIEAIFDDSRCRLHMDIPLIRSYHQPRKESESDADDSLDLSQYQLNAGGNVKTELIDYSLPPELPKMETLPTILFEESSESVNADNFDGAVSCDPQEETEEEKVDVTDLPEENKNGEEENVTEGQIDEVTMETEKAKEQVVVENEGDAEQNAVVEKEELDKNGEETMEKIVDNVQEIMENEQETGDEVADDQQELESTSNDEMTEQQKQEVGIEEKPESENEIDTKAEEKLESTAVATVTEESKMEVDET